MSNFGDFNIGAIKIDEDNNGSIYDEDRGYKITYEIVFNDEDEQQLWYEFLRDIKIKYNDCDTISQRIIKAIQEWKNV